MRSLGLIALLFALDVRPSDACAVAPPMGQRVEIAEEEALIVWDATTKTEHFIRRAAFRSSARQFGFLVPTPTTPQLSEVDDSIFNSLAQLIERPIEYDRSDRHYEAGGLLFEACMLTAKSSDDSKATAPAAVRVLATANVAGFDATTVEADDANALTAWLGQHGFEATPQLTAWLERYVTDHWKVTAFVVAGEQQTGDTYQLATRAVKMTFPAERPFYPYREPQIEMTVESTAKMSPQPRLLRVFFASNERYAATLAGQPWSAKLVQAKKTTWSQPDLTTLLGAQQYLTVFADDSSPRRGIEELYFAPSADKSDVTQPPQVVKYPKTVTIPVDLIILGAIVAFFVVRRLRR